MLKANRSTEPTMNGNRVRPPAWLYYAAGAAVIFTGFGFFLYILLHDLSHMADNLTQIVVPGEKDLTLLPKLRYTIFLEEQSVVDGQIYSTKRQSLAGLTCKVNSLVSGNKIDLHRPSMSMNYNFGGRSGSAVLEFVTEDAGVYRIACEYPEDTQGPQAVVAVGPGFAEGLFRTIFQCLAVLFGSGLFGVIIIVVGIIRRSKPPSVGLTPPPI